MEQSPFEKLTGSQPVKKFSTFYGTRRFITAVTSARHLSLPSAIYWYYFVVSIHKHLFKVSHTVNSLCVPWRYTVRSAVWLQPFLISAPGGCMHRLMYARDTAEQDTLDEILLPVSGIRSRLLSSPAGILSLY